MNAWRPGRRCDVCNEPLDVLGGDQMAGRLLCEWCIFHEDADMMAGLEHLPPEQVELDAGADFGG